ncbi:hypothetical protein BDP55DRAFT_22702 [Colletotrichum godetiae]|uniref:Uncharacterized protein n=1 Tax=Colletotrichum godetiae TaxID=1209918 RepID=A0AAJ0B046_9PEZI|nr:uncharacterized protein BDP55DRAFT_22702 [Colletotrichum godetiae]KAK1701494.1 hypothetical protein BDP55DRAFT_22702 [Colletotrichum godetiae]
MLDPCRTSQIQSNPAQLNQNSPIPMHNPAIQRPRQHQAPSTKHQTEEAPASKGTKVQSPRSKGALPQHPVPNGPVHFPFDPRPAVPFFYSTLPGPLFLSWAYFLSQSPSRVVSSLAAAVPRPLEPNSIRLQVEPAPLFAPCLSICLGHFSLPLTTAQPMATIQGQLKHHRGSIQPPSTSWYYGYLETQFESQHGGNT